MFSQRSVEQKAQQQTPWERLKAGGEEDDRG